MADSIVAPQLRPSLSQGDIIQNVRIVEAHISPDERTFSVMVLSHGCEIDKKNSQVVLAARVLSLAELGGDATKIKDGSALTTFYLPEIDQVVDFRNTFRVLFTEIGATGFKVFEGDEKPQRIFPGSDPRVHSLTDHGRSVLWGRIVGFYTRRTKVEELLIVSDAKA